MLEGLGSLVVSFGQLAAGAGGAVLTLALAALIVKHFAAGAGTGPAALAPGAGADLGTAAAVAKTVVVAPQQYIEARKVRIKHMTGGSQNIQL